MKKPTPVRESIRSTFRPRIESLETRLTPTTYTVSSLADSGAGSLRAAITSVNGDTTPDEIDFSVAGVVMLTSGALPAITNTVKLNGRSAPGFANAPLVELDNNSFGGLTLSGPNSILSSLSIVNAGGAGVTLEGDNITVVGNYIGLALDGSVAANMGSGLFVDNSRGDLIGGTTALDRNVISANGKGNIGPAGISLGQAGIEPIALNATIEGNFIGTDPSGNPVSLGPGAGGQDSGILINSNDNTVGGTEAGAGNVIAYNGTGIYIHVGNGNAFLSNSIYNNGTGSFLQNNGNNNQQPPGLFLATQSGAATRIAGVMNGQANTAYTIQVFVSQKEAGGQGQTLLGTLSATTNASGFATFILNVQVPANAGSFFTALATSPSRNTSEFGVAISLTTSPNEAFVASAYGLLLHRAFDFTGTGWIDLLNNGSSTATVLLGIQASDEYLRLQVTAMYTIYLHRAPDSGGGQAWFDYLRAGGTFEGMAAGLTSSPEYFVLQGSTNQGFVTGLYHDVLNRSASDAEVAGWVANLNSGASRLDVSVAFLTSQEYRTNLVQADYLTFLLRPADPGGLAAWVSALNAGAIDQQVLAGIFGSPEGFQLWS
jgi:hypothetical protein